MLCGGREAPQKVRSHLLSGVWREQVHVVGWNGSRSDVYQLSQAKKPVEEEARVLLTLWFGFCLSWNLRECCCDCMIDPVQRSEYACLY